MQKAIFTIVSNNYLHYARTLLQSVAEHHPECARFCVIVDKDYSHAESYAAEFTVIRLSELLLPDPQQFIFRYSILELNTAVKPWAFEHLLKNGYKDVVYIDPDIRLFAAMDDVFELLNKDADIVITPHLLAPMSDDKTPSELDIRRAGTYNFGFCALTASQNTFAFLAWWQQKLEFGCVVDLAGGIFVDQSWIDLVPGMFPRVSVLRHPGYNVAYWNLAQRTVRRVDQHWAVNDDRLVFFHFSGFNAEYPESFSKHQNRFTFENMGEEKVLAADYANSLLENGARIFKSLPYGYGYFDDGVTPVADVFRRIFRKDEELRMLMGSNPFEHPESLRTLVVDGDPGGSVMPTYAMYAVWMARDDLKEAFSLRSSESVARFYEWFASEGQQYFSQQLVDEHAKLYSSATLRTAVANAGGVSMIARSRYVQRMYLAVLGREVDELGRETYEPIATTKLGVFKTLVALLLSAESRARPAWQSRARRALGIATAFLFADEPPPPSVIVAKTSKRKNVSGPIGWATTDADLAEQGCWVMPGATLACVVAPGMKIRIEGGYFANYVRQQAGDPKSTFSIYLGGRKIAGRPLRDDGPFSLEVTVPNANYVGLTTLEFRSSGFFIPKTIGLNEDERELSWRASRITVGSNVLFDKSRIPALLPLDGIVKTQGVNIIGYIAAESGVGESARSFAKGCNAVGIAYKTLDVGYQNRNRQSDLSAESAATKTGRFPINVLHVNADQTPSTLQTLPPSVGEHDVNIGFWHWEQPMLPTSYLPSFDGLAEVWVPSAFVQNAVATISPLPVFKVPHVVEFAIPVDSSRAKFGLPDGLFIVLVMYDFDSYQYRKNPQAAIEAYRRAYGLRSDTGLVIKTINADRDPEGYRALLDSVSGLQNVFLIDRYLTRNEVYELQDVCDCFLSLHRAEGFGLGLAEMMYLGKPVVGTDWSGNTEFMHLGNSYPVRYELRALNHDLGVYQAGQLWAEADLDHAVYVLRDLIEDDQQRARIANQAHQDLRKYFSAAAIGSIYRRRFSLLGLWH